MTFSQVFFATLQTELQFKTPLWAAILTALVTCASETPEEAKVKRAKQLSVIEGDPNGEDFSHLVDDVDADELLAP